MNPPLRLQLLRRCGVPFAAIVKFMKPPFLQVFPLGSHIASCQPFEAHASLR